MLSDLSPGDRMSIKGKLFELQKKLSILDLEDKLDPTNLYSFKPKLNHFDLPDRTSFLDQSDKAELIRQQKKKMLVESLANQSDETCTFTPTIYTSSQSQRKYNQRRQNHHIDDYDRPVYERLNEEGKKYAKEQQKRKQQAKQFDFEGNKMFTPQINKHSTTLTQSRFQSNSHEKLDQHTSIYIPPQANTVTAEEFLYQDAKDRELRLKQLVLKYEEDARKSANTQKINISSEKLLKQKLERHIRHVFSLFDKDNNDLIQYEDVTKFMEKYFTLLFEATEQMIRAKELVWMVVDHHKTGTVTRTSFQDICMSFLLHKNPSSFIPSIQRLALKRQQEATPVQAIPSYSTLSTMKERDLLDFKGIILKLIDFAEEKKHQERQRRHQKTAAIPWSPLVSRGSDKRTNHPSQPSFGHDAAESQVVEDGGGGSEDEEKVEVDYKPKLTPQSMKLAEQKKKKELAMLATILSTQSPEGKKVIEGGEEGGADQSMEGESMLGGEDEERSLANQSLSSLSHYDLMHARALLTQQKKEALKTKIHQQEAKKYTFHPKLVSHQQLSKAGGHPSQPPQHADDQLDPNEETQEVGSESMIDDASSQANQSQVSSPQHYVQQNVHQRLYQLGDKKSLNKKSHLTVEEANPQPPTYLQELQSCTFHPKIGRAPPTSFKQPLVQQIHGTEKTIQRVKNAHEVKMKAKEEEENEWKKQDAGYRKNRDVLMKQGAKAPELKTEERMKLQRNKNEQTKLSPVKTDLIVNVKILSNKTARIRIAKGDDPLDLAQRFSKIYSLDANATQVLYNVLYQSMVQNHLIEPPVEIVEEEMPPPPPPVSEPRHHHHHHRRLRRKSKRHSFIAMSAILGGGAGAGAFDPLDPNGDYSDKEDEDRDSNDEDDKLSGSEEDDDDESYSSYTGTSTLRSDEDDEEDDDEEDYDEDDVHEYVDGEEGKEDGSDDEDEEYNIHDPPDTSRSGSVDAMHVHTQPTANKAFQQFNESPRKGKKKRSILVDLL